MLAWALAALLFALAAACAVQAIQTWQRMSLEATLTEQTRTLSERVRETVAARQREFTKAVWAPALLAALDTWNGTAPPPASALAALRAELGGAKRVEIYGPELVEILEVDLVKFGYSRAYALAAARAAGEFAPAYAERDADGALALGLARTIRNDDRLLGYAYVVVDATPIATAIDAVDAGAGRVEIKQGGDRPSVIAAVGRDVPEAPQFSAIEIPESIFTIVGRAPRVVAVSDYLTVLQGRPPLLLIGAALVLFAFGLLAAWRALGERRSAVTAKLPQGVKGPLEKLGRRDKVAEATMPTVITPAAPRAVKGPEARTSPAVAVSVERSMFRAYDIRGVVGAGLNPEVARLIGQAIGSEIRDRGLSECAVARDGRLSGPALVSALIEGLRATGCDVIDVGAVPTPVLYFATYNLNTGSGVMVTGSHNPPDYNGFKIVIGGETLADSAIQALYTRIVEGRFVVGRGGSQNQDVSQAYVERIVGDVQTERMLKVVVDAGNGIAGPLGLEVLKGVGCDVMPLHCEVDGSFPNHHPDPSDPRNLSDLILTVKRMGADLGIAFDGDGDRLGVVTRTGDIIYPDRLLMLFAIDVLTRNPGATIIYDVKCTGHLQNVILRHGGSPLMWKTGHSLIKAKMREENAELAGEMSGHFFFRERWFGFDDGIYAAARLVEILAASELEPGETLAALPNGVSTPELKIPMAEGAHYAFIERLRERAQFPDARLSTIDGVRADYPDGWGLIRASNTTPVLVLRFDADTEDALLRIQNIFRAQILALDPKLTLPF